MRRDQYHIEERPVSQGGETFITTTRDQSSNVERPDYYGEDTPALPIFSLASAKQTDEV